MFFSVKKCTHLIIVCTMARALVAETIPFAYDREESADVVAPHALENPAAVRYTIDPLKLTTQEIMGGESVKTRSKCRKKGHCIAGGSLVVQNHFLGAQKQESGQINTDCSGCVGTEQFLVCIKGRVRTFNKKSGEVDNVLNVSLDGFFRAIGGGSWISDPRPQFDAHSKRWLIMAINVGQGLDASDKGGKGKKSVKATDELPTSTTGIPNVTRLLFAVSDGDIITPETVWSFYILDNTIDKPEISFFDFETLGWDEDAVYVGSNPVYALGQDSNFYVIQKASLLSGGPAAVSAFYGLTSQFNMFTLQPACNFDKGSHVGYAIARDITSTRRILLSQVLNPGSLEPVLTAPVAVTVPRLAGVIDPAALGSINPIGALSDRITSAPHIRNNQLWAVSDIGMDSSGQRPVDPADVDRVGGGYFRIDVSNPAGPFVVAQSGSLFDPTTTTPPRSYFFNSIMTNSDGRVLIGSTVCGETERLNAAVSLLLDDQNSFETALYTNTTTDFNPTDDIRQEGVYRWGDYSMVTLDPQDTKKCWAIEMYCSDTNTWGVEVAKVAIRKKAA